MDHQYIEIELSDSCGWFIMDGWQSGRLHSSRKRETSLGSEVRILYRPLRVHGWTARLLLSEIYLS